MLGWQGMDSETLTRKFSTFPFPPKMTLGDSPPLARAAPFGLQLCEIR